MISIRNVAAGLALSFLAQMLLAVEPGGEEKNPAAAAKPSAQAIGAWIKQLDADEFSVREEASRRLAGAGCTAIPPLRQAALEGSLETTVRAIEILCKLLEREEDATKTAAKEALETIADSDRPSAAWRAKQALQPKPNPAQNTSDGTIIFNQVMPGGMGQGAIQIVANAAGAGRRVSIRTVNGVKEIEATEGNRKIKIHDDPKQGIRVEIATTGNGKTTTEKFEAKDAAELKTKYAKAYEIYHHYAQGPGNAVIQVQLNANPGPIPQPGPGPQAVPAQPARAPAPARKGTDRAASLLRTLKTIGRQVEQCTPQAELDKASGESRSELKKLAADMQAQLAALQDRLRQADKKPPKQP